MAIYYLTWPTEILSYRFEISEILDMVKKQSSILFFDSNLSEFVDNKRSFTIF